MSYQETLDAFAAAVLPAIYTRMIEDGTTCAFDDWKEGLALEAFSIAEVMMRCRKDFYPFPEEDTNVE